jgi:hypothetical protein
MPFPLVEADQFTITHQAVLRAIEGQGDPFITRRLRGATFVAARYPCLHVSAPKCASTKTKRALWDLDELGPSPADIHQRTEGDGRLSVFSVGRERAEELLFGNAVLRFRVHRDPVQRLASAYVDKIVHGKWKAVSSSWDAFIRYCGSVPETDVTFDQFACFACSQPDHERDQHWMSQWRLTFSDAIRYNLIVRVDHYAEDMSQLYERLGVPRRKWPSFHLKENASGREALTISAATKQMIRRAYEKDCDPPDVQAS